MGTISISDRPPAVCWHSSQNLWYTVIGYHRNRKGTISRTYHWLGSNEKAARFRAKGIQQQWHQRVIDVRERDALTELMTGANPKTKPLWDEAKSDQEIDDILVQRKLLTPDVEPSAPLCINLAVKAFCEAKKAKLGLGEKGINHSSYRHYCEQVTNALRLTDADGKRVIPEDQQINTLTYEQIEKFHDGWWRKQTSKELSKRRVCDLLKGFKRFLDWCDRKPSIRYQHPVGGEKTVAELFTFRNINPIRIKRYDGEELRTLFSFFAADENGNAKRELSKKKVKLYALMGLNLGYYGVDIATLEPGMIEDKDGEWYIKRRRHRTMHQTDESFVTEVWVWPETRALMEELRAGENYHGLFFLTGNGTPLQGQEKKKDTVGYLYAAVIADGNAALETPIHFPHKQFRKVGSSWVGNHCSEVAMAQYLSRPPKGVDKFYHGYEVGKLTESLKMFREQLRADKVF